jgi:hypothetical protein
VSELVIGAGGAALCARGDLTVWFDEAAIAAWNAPPSGRPGGQRHDAIERIAVLGRRQWRKESGAHRRTRAENGMYRYKHLTADRLRAKHVEARKREALIAVNIINRMTALGMPVAVKAVA